MPTMGVAAAQSTKESRSEGKAMHRERATNPMAAPLQSNVVSVRTRPGVKRYLRANRPGG